MIFVICLLVYIVMKDNRIKMNVGFFIMSIM